MNYIYVDNYRGFSDTVIPINDVSFLVGENSTGKTSLLGLLKLLSPPDFWLKSEIDFRQVGFGTFKDVVSVGASDKSYFSVGTIFDKSNDKIESIKEGSKSSENSEDKSLVAFVLTFVEHEGMPKLASILSYRNGIEVFVRFVGKSVRFKYKIITRNVNAEDFANTTFLKWYGAYKMGSTGFKILKDSARFSDNLPPIFVLSYIEERIADKGDEKGRGLSFEISTFFHDIIWLAPIRSKPKKTYDEFSLDYSPEGDHTPYLIRKKLDNKNESNGFVKFMKQIGLNSGLFKKVQIKNYGRGTTAPFELDIVLGDDPLSVSSVGYGVSQALPVIVEIFARPTNTWFAIQQPEVHLHPKAQAALGEAFFTMAATQNKKFLIETHSDFTIDRFRISYRHSKKKPNAQILFFERTKSGNKVTQIKIDERGEVDSDQPATYREFFMREEMNLLGL